MDILVWADGRLTWNNRTEPCRLGRSGLSMNKREGDGATPVGTWTLLRVLYRPDRGEKPQTALPVTPLSPDDGWCDDPTHADYNQPVRLPHPAGCEQMWREDRLYDVVVVLDHNSAPPIPGLGSAIFLHVAHPEGKPTQGCIALEPDTLHDLLKDCVPGDRLVVTG